MLWSVAQVLALAPDAASQRAARELAGPHRWREAGWDPEDGLLWGLCPGSGTRLYQTGVDTSGPAYRCSCPSRKIPCKHALGLLLLWAGGGLPEATPPGWAAEWYAAREARTARTTGPRTISPTTIERRAGRVAAGLAELDRWLADQVRHGIAGAARLGYGHWDAMAARLVDAQAPGAAGSVRRLASAAAAGAPDRLLTELALLRLLVAAHDRLDALPADLAATVRTRVGYQVATDDVLASPPVRDRWLVIAIHDEADEFLTVRRVWLSGVEHGRPALILTFTPSGQQLPGDFVLGTTVDADLCFYPGGAPLRALVSARHGPPEPAAAVGGLRIGAALRGYAAGLAADPWLDRWPMWLAGVVPVRTGARWAVVDDTGAGLPLARSPEQPWRLVSVSGNRPVRLAGEWTPAGLRPLTVWSADGPEML